jgi:hypothetical protein
VWHGLEQGASLEGVARAAAAAFDLATSDALAAVQSTLTSFRQHGLVAGSDLPERAPVPAEPLVDPRIPPYRAVAVAVASERRYAVLGSRFAVRFTDLAQEHRVHPLFAHLETTEASTADVVVDVVASGGRHFVYRDGEPARGAPGIDRLAPIVKEVLWPLAVYRFPYFLYVHAGVVGDGQRCLLLPAASGSGKSSLTTALCHLGLDYLSDEVALIEPDTFRVRSIPLSLCVKDSGWSLAARYRPDVWTLATHQRGDGKVVRYLPPPLSKGFDPGRSYPASHLVFPRYDPEAVTELRPIARVEALRRLMDECLAIRPPLDATNVEGLVHWMAGLATYELPMSSLDHAAELVRDLLRS